MSDGHGKVSNGMFNELCTCEACVAKTKETRKHYILKAAVDLLAGIAHYTLHVEQELLTDSITIDFSTCADMEAVAERLGIPLTGKTDRWGCHWEGRSGNLVLLHTCGDRCGKRPA